MYYFYTFTSILNPTLFTITSLHKNKSQKLKISHLKLLHVLALLGRLRAPVQCVKIATLYFQCNQDELFPKLIYFNVFHFHHSFIKNNTKRLTLD
jgi:hypothetical protein